MTWNERYPLNVVPTMDDIRAYLNDPLFDACMASLEAACGVAPKIEHSRCSLAPGWNVKYKKSGRAVCTLYPNDGYFSAMVVIGEKKLPEVELLLPALDPYTQALYLKTPVSMGGKWLFVDVKSEAVLHDVLKLIALKLQQ